MKCFAADDYDTVLQKRFGTLNEKTKFVTNYLKEHGYKVVEKWEYEYVAQQGIGSCDMNDAGLVSKNYTPLLLRFFVVW